MSNWQSVNPNQFLPPVITDALKGIAEISSAVLEAKKIISDLTPSIPSIPDIPSVSDLISKAQSAAVSAAAAAASELLSALQSLIEGAKIHVMTVPIGKIYPTPPPSILPASLSDLQTWQGVSFAPSSAASGAYQSLITGSGGNAGFYQQFANSLFNVADPNRPMYANQTDAVVMATVLIGAPSYTAITLGASVLDQLFKPKGPIGGVLARTLPVPQNVSIKPVVSSSSQTVSMSVNWDAPDPSISPTYFPGLNLSVARYAIIKMTGPRATSVTSVLDIFPTQALTTGMTVTSSLLTATVVAIGTGTNSSFMDTSPPPTTGEPVYYAVTWETNISEPSASGVASFDKLSSVSKATQTSPPAAQTGAPASWHAEGGIVNIFPDLASAANAVLAKAKTLTVGNPTPTARLNDAVNVSLDMANNLLSQATDLVANIQRLTSTLSRPGLPSMYTTTMTSSVGGNAFLLSELANRLGDMSDPSRPPFDGGEYVCGLCFVAGAPHLADLSAAIAFLEALFGGGNNQPNPITATIAALNTAVTSAETAVFGPDMKPINPVASSTVAANGAVVSVPIDPLTGKPVVAPAAVIGNDGSPLSSDDPANPNSGFTNVVTADDLC